MKTEHECGACHGTGWVPRDADIGTEQKCFSCDGSGQSEDAAQPVAGELPQLPAGWIVRKDDDGVIVVQKPGVGGYAARHDDDNIASTILYAFASDLLAAQPVQQPALIDPLDLVGALREFAGDAGYSHHDYADVMRQAADEIDRLKGWQPAAVVGQEAVGEVLGVWHRHDQAVISVRDSLACRVGQMLYTAPVPAAGVQCDKQTDLSKRLLFKANDTDGNQISVMKADLIAICCEANRYYSGMMNWKATAEAKDLPRQPDSGRDAALREIPDLPQPIQQVDAWVTRDYGRKTGSETLEANGEYFTPEQMREYGDARALAAHPAPSSDAGLDEVQRLLEREQRDAQGLASLLRKERERFQFLHSSNKDADGWEWGVARVRIVDGKVEYLWGVSDHSDIDSILAAHPANGAQAGDVEEQIDDVVRKLRDMDAWVCSRGGHDQRKLIAAILAAAKKGGA